MGDDEVGKRLYTRKSNKSETSCKVITPNIDNSLRKCKSLDLKTKNT